MLKNIRNPTKDEEMWCAQNRIKIANLDYNLLILIESEKNNLALTSISISEQVRVVFEKYKDETNIRDHLSFIYYISRPSLSRYLSGTRHSDRNK